MNDEESWLEALRSDHIQKMFDHPESVDIDSEEFQSLPAEVKHELLTEIKDSHRRRYRRKNEERKELPKDAGDFSSFQLQGLMKRGKITQQIDSLRKEMTNTLSDQFLEIHKDINFKSDQSYIESKRIASDSKASYIFIKAFKSKEENVLFNTNLEDDYHRFKELDEESNEQSSHYRRLQRVPAKFEVLKSLQPVGLKFLSDGSSDEENVTSTTQAENVNHGSTSSAEKQKQDDVEYMSTDSDDSDFAETATNPESVVINNVLPVLINKKKKIEIIEMKDSSMAELNLPNNFESKKDFKGEKTTDKTTITFDSKILPDSSNKPNDEPAVVSQEEMLSPISPLSKVIDVDADSSKLLPMQQSATQEGVDSEEREILPTSSSEITQHNKETSFVQQFSNTVAEKTKEELVAFQEDLKHEQYELQQNALKLSRQAATVSSEKYQDVQELLQLFGIPYLVSPMEAEAQCAQLDYSNLTDGSVTDDSDIFLFGGETVYKNVFDQNKYTELYISKTLKETLHLDRPKLIALAMLTGSDYTEGMQGVGGVTAMEILHEFSRDEAQETLNHLKEWMLKMRSGKEVFAPGCNLLSKLKRSDLPRNFNSDDIWKAYLEPTVDTSDERFEWGTPDITAIKEFANEKLGWLSSRTDEILSPVMRKWKGNKEKQKTLDKFFVPVLAQNDVISKRLRNVLDVMNGPNKKNDVSSAESSKKTKQKRKAMESEATASTSTSPYFDNDFVEVSKRGRVKTTKCTMTVSSNEKVQAKKEENLLKAAAERLKPLPPFVRVNKINKAISKRLQGRGKRKARGKNRTLTILNQINSIPDVMKPLVSSESDSD
ncbi:DNA excision repair protein ERCC-5 homolog isoform X2 [Hydractinia symbiolongicarpus]|nr:DNA excision repair protein ERCC-5 homolog isoform X2 [Hydractinia symbiolongicarpus]